MRSTEYIASHISISGFKYVLGPEISILRRFVWLLVILLASAWMIWNIQGRVTYFLSRPSAITTDLKFKDKVTFPKVTICNENMFRSSSVFSETTSPRTSASLYEAVDRYLQAIKGDVGNHSTRNDVISKYGELLSDRNIKAFYRRVGHQKETLINRCSWKGQTCGPENFTEVFTNMGVCYQFKPNPDDIFVDKANKDGGLSVTLLVEQYDYMRGPQDSVGALVVIADQDETEAVAKDHGIGVTVGQSVSIGLQKSEVIDLPSPHGDCGTARLENHPPDVPYTYLRCQLDCLTSFIKKKCGCVSVYMPGEHFPYCSMAENLQCLRPNEELFYRSNIDRACHCPTPCRSVTYNPSLSLVHFSAIYKQRLAFLRKLVSPSTVRSALIVQFWGLLNSVDPSATEFLSHLGLMLIDYRSRWKRLAFTTDNVLKEAVKLMDLVSQRNLKNRVMAELKPEKESSAAWRFLNITVLKIKKMMSRSEDLMEYVNEIDIKEMDVMITEKILINYNTGFVGWLTPVFGSVKYLISLINEDSIIVDFISISTDMLQINDSYRRNHSATSGISSTVSVNDSEMFGTGSEENVSAVIQDWKNLLADMDVSIGIGKEMTLSLGERYGEDLSTVWMLWTDTVTDNKPEFYSDNLVAVDIYLKDLGVQESRKSPAYSLEGLLCDIGGSIGLCLGGSVLTLFEIFDILAILFGSKKKPTTDLALADGNGGNLGVVCSNN